MKKSVIILIGIIYAASITLVTFFGLKYADHYDEEIPVSEVKITNDGIKTDSSGNKYIVLYPNEDGELTFQVEYIVSPDNATNSKLEFVMDSPYASVDENGLVTFNTIGQSAWLYIYTTDGTRIGDSIEIVFNN